MRIIARHAGTVLVGQLAVIAFGVTDTLVAGRHSSEALAALSIGSAVYISIFVALMGALQAQLPIWAQLRGAGAGAELGRSVRQALYLCVVACCAGTAALLFPRTFLQWVEVPQALQSGVEAYLAVLAAALPPALLFRTFATLNQALGKPQLVTWLQVASLAVKAPLSIWFAFGGLGVPAMGLVGCAWATVLVNYAMLGMALWALRSHPVYEPYRLWQPLEPPDATVLRSFARLGVPAALSVMVEVTSFTLMALFSARLGTIASASHQVASNLTAVLYMMPLSLGLATSARVSFWRGSGDERRARLALRLGLKLALGMAMCSCAVVLVGSSWLARAYVGNNPPVVALAASLLGWVAVYHLADSVQALCAFVLRSYGVAVAPMVGYGVLLWGLGLGGGYVLAYRGVGALPPLREPSAFWMAGAFALGLTAAFFIALLWRAVRKHRPAPH